MRVGMRNEIPKILMIPNLDNDISLDSEVGLDRPLTLSSGCQDQIFASAHAKTVYGVHLGG